MRQVLIVDNSITSLQLHEHIVRLTEIASPICFEDPVDAMGWCEGKSAEYAAITDTLSTLDWVAENLPYLILLDYEMPKMNGIEFLKQMRALPGFESVPTVMVSGMLDRDLSYQAFQAGATDILPKSLDSVALRTVIRSMVTLRERQLQINCYTHWLADEVKQATQQILERERDAILRLSMAAEFRDPETGAHLQRMSRYAHKIGIRLGLSEEDQWLLLEASPMHDVGKVGIPDHILLKSEKLTPVEYRIMQQHTRIGYKLLSDSDSQLMQAAAVIALTHHEKFDGTGYPNQLIGEQIPLFGRIVAVADVFDALTSVRPYKDAWPLEKARDWLIEQRGHHFDPMIVDAFLAEWSQVLEIHDEISEKPRR